MHERRPRGGRASGDPQDHASTVSFGVHSAVPTRAYRARPDRLRLALARGGGERNGITPPGPRTSVGGHKPVERRSSPESTSLPAEILRNVLSLWPRHHSRPAQDARTRRTRGGVRGALPL